MAKDHRDRKAKVRVFYAEVEGDDETIKDGLQSLATALVRTIQPPLPPRPKPMLPAAPPPNGAQPNLFDQVDHPVDEGQVFDAELADDEEHEIPASRSKPPRPRKGRTYSVVSDLNLRPEGQQSLVDFYRTKSPSDQQEQIAVFIHYLSRTRGVAAVTDRHVYTCYKEVGERVPPDILQVARNTAARKGWVDAGDPKNLRLTVNGENYVEHSLPNAKTNGK